MEELVVGFDLVEGKVAFVDAVGMALVAVGFEDGLDGFLEKCEGGGGSLGVEGGNGEEQKE